LSLKAAAKLLAFDLQRSRCKISTKSVIMATDESIKVSVGGYLRGHSIVVTPVKSATYLGIGTATGVRRINQFIKHRLMTIRGRVMRIRLLNKVSKKTSRLFNTGAYPQATYG